MTEDTFPQHTFQKHAVLECYTVQKTFNFQNRVMYQNDHNIPLAKKKRLFIDDVCCTEQKLQMLTNHICLFIYCT